MGDHSGPLASEGATSRLFVVKVLGLPEVTDASLFNELFGNLLARELGVATAAPAVIEVSPVFAEAVNPQLLKQGFSVKPGLGVGCQFVAGGTANVDQWSPLTPEELVQAARIYGFDLLVQNPDRRHEKPNCLQLRGQLIAYDFELAFSFLLVVGEQEEPWEVSKLDFVTKHLFYQKLRRQDVDWQPFVSAVGGLTYERLDVLTECLPGAWQHRAARIRMHVGAVRERLSDFEGQLRRSLE